MQVLGSTSGVGLTSGKTHVQAAGVDLRSLGLTWGGRQVVQTCLMQQRVVVVVVVAFSWCLTSLGCMFGDFDV